MSGELNYHNYLGLDTLLSLQRPAASESQATASTVLSEQFFIIAHQASELWLKQIIADLDAVVVSFETTDDTSGAEWIVDLLQRAAELIRVLHTQVVALDRLPVHDFALFRKFLGTASGAQSQQFRQLHRFIGNAEREGALFTSFSAWVERAGYTVADLARKGIDADIYHRIIEAMLDVGNGYWRWAIGHICLVTRTLGSNGGTGGTSGADYLMDRCTLPFAELRKLRSQAHIGHSINPVSIAAD